MAVRKLFLIAEVDWLEPRQAEIGQILSFIRVLNKRAMSPPVSQG